MNGYYEVSNLGKVRSLDHYASNGKANNVLYKGKILKGWLDGKEHYLQVTLSKNNIKTKHQIHRLVAKAFIPNPDNKPEVNHIDCNKLNNTIDNLEWCTSKENKDHALKNGLYDTEKFRHRKPNQKSIKLKIEGKIHSINEWAKIKNTTYMNIYNKYVRKSDYIVIKKQK